MSIFSNRHWHRKCIEPVKRKHGGNGSQWVSHRFEIRGGISLRDAMIYDMMIQPNRFVAYATDGSLQVCGMPVRLAEAA